MADIHAAMLAVMQDVQSIGKDDRNTDQNFMFRGVDAVVNVVGPIMRRHGVLGPVPVEVREIRDERYETKRGANMRNVTLRVRWQFIAADGSTVDAESAGEAADAGDKATSKAHSVAYRTVLLQTFCIPTHETDPDAETHERAARPWRPTDQASIGDIRRAIADVAKARGYDTDRVAGAWVDWGHAPLWEATDADKDDLLTFYDRIDRGEL